MRQSQTQKQKKKEKQVKWLMAHRTPAHLVWPPPVGAVWLDVPGVPATPLLLTLAPGELLVPPSPAEHRLAPRLGALLIHD